MLLTNRFGVTASSSRRVKLTAEAGSAFALLETNTRPVVVAAHRVELFARVRSTAATAPPARSPHSGAVRRTVPSSAQSPQTASKVPVHSLQIRLASSSVRSPRPNVFVRYAVRPVPAHIVPLTVG